MKDALSTKQIVMQLRQIPALSLDCPREAQEALDRIATDAIAEIERLRGLLRAVLDSQQDGEWWGRNGPEAAIKLVRFDLLEQIRNAVEAKP